MRPASQRPASGSLFRKLLFYAIVALVLLPFVWLAVRALLPQQTLEDPLAIGGNPSARAEQARIWADEVAQAEKEGREPDYSKKPGSDGSPVGASRAPDPGRAGHAPGLDNPPTGGTRPPGDRQGTGAVTR